MKVVRLRGTQVRQGFLAFEQAPHVESSRPSREPNPFQL